LRRRPRDNRQLQPLVTAAAIWQASRLINDAGRGEFAFMDAQAEAGFERLPAVNTLAPKPLAHALRGFSAAVGAYSPIHACTASRHERMRRRLPIIRRHARMTASQRSSMS
jgi:hypothetical protein